MAYDSRLRLTQGADESYFANANVSATDPLVLAIFTLKASLTDADPGVLQKKVTTSAVSGVGQITADGSTTSGAAVARFDFTAAQTAALSPQTYWFDVKVKTASGRVLPDAKGIVTVTMQTTTSTS
jgi:hypothetical protein